MEGYNIEKQDILDILLFLPALQQCIAVIGTDASVLHHKSSKTADFECILYQSGGDLRVVVIVK